MFHTQNNYVNNIIQTFSEWTALPFERFVLWPFFACMLLYLTIHVQYFTFIPSWAALIAATYPPGPDPITTKSTSPVILKRVLIKFGHMH